MQTLVSNFVSGLIILYERPFRRGDIVEHEGVTGSVTKIRTRSTLMQTFDEAELVVPNAELLAKRITNWTLTNYRTRVVIPVAVAYGSDVELVRESLLEVTANEPRLMDTPRVFFAAFGDSAMNFQLVIRVDIREKMEVVSDLHFAIDKMFREKGIKIPHTPVVT
jgi:small-conductance mechanosensitive channel